MIPYLISFALCIFFLYLWKITSERHRILSKIFALIAILIPSLLSAFRGYSIGVDTLVYQKPFFDIAKKYGSFISYLNTQNTSSEVLYHLVTWIAARFFNIQTLFFFLQILMITPIFIALNKTKNKKTAILGVIFYLLFAFNESLNMARQSIALSFSILAITLVIDKEYLKTIIVSIIAILFHSSAYLIIPVCILILILTSSLSYRAKVLISLIVILTTFLISFYILGIVGTLSAIIENETLNKYANYSERFSSVSFNFPQFFIWLIILLVVILFTKHTDKNYTREIYILLSSIYLSSFIANTIIHYSNRAFYYFAYPAILYFLPKVISEHKSAKTARFLAVLLIIILIVQWVLVNVYWNYNHTTPYIMEAYS